MCCITQCLTGDAVSLQGTALRKVLLQNYLFNKKGNSKGELGELGGKFLLLPIYVRVCLSRQSWVYLFLYLSVCV